MFTVQKHGMAEVIIRKSKFIANVYPIDSQAKAIEIINRTKKEYWDARHNVYAYKLKSEALFSKYTDDGEPQGTAGLPIMNLIDKLRLQNVLIVVTRYFGGTLLGTGGLIKAYTNAAKKGINEAQTLEIVDKTKIEIEFEYELKDKIAFFLEKNLYDEKDVYYGETVKIIINVPTLEIGIFCKNMEELAEGRLKLKKL